MERNKFAILPKVLYTCEIRCQNCNKLLAKSLKQVKGVEIKCPRCRTINKI